MKNFTSLIIAMVLTICTLTSNVSAFHVNAVGSIAKTETGMMDYLEKFETPYYGSTWKDFDLDADERIDVFDLNLLKRKGLNGENGVTVATIRKLQDWLLAKPDAHLEIKTIENPKHFKEVNSSDTQYIQNLFSNDFRYVYATNTEVDGYFAITLWFLGIDETIIEGATFTAFTDTLEYADAVISEAEGFYIIELGGNYVLTFKENILNDEPEETTSTPEETETTTATEATTTVAETTEPTTESTTSTPVTDPTETTTTYDEPHIGPAAVGYNLTDATSSIIPAVKEALSNSFDKKEIVTDTQRGVAALYFKNDNLQVGIIVSLAKKTEITGEVIYFDSDLIIVYDDIDGFEVFFK